MATKQAPVLVDSKGKPITDPNGIVFSNPNDPMIKVYADTRAPADLTEAEWKEIHTKIDKSFWHLLIYFPWLGRMLSMMVQKRVYVMDPDEGMYGGKFRTMATDGQALYIWPQWVLYHDQKEVIGVCLHELFHALLLHPARGLGFDPYLRNIAMDIVVDLHVNDGIMEKLGKPHQEMKPEYYAQANYYVPVDRDYPYDHSMRDEFKNPLPWEEVYRRLLEKMSGKSKEKVGSAGGLGQEDMEGMGLGSRGRDSHGPWKPGQRPADADGNRNNAPFDPNLPAEWARNAHAALSGGETNGFVPSNIKRLVDEMLNPPIPWFRLLSNYIEPTPGDVSYCPGDTRFDEPMLWMLDTYEMKWIVASFDTSGSMSDQDIGACVHQANSLISGFPNMDGRLFFWDAMVHDRMDIKEWRDEGVPRQVTGGGGTSVIPQFEAMDEEDLLDKTKAVVCFTDGYVDWDRFGKEVIPKLDDGTYRFDIIFVFTNTVSEAPKHIKIMQTRIGVEDHY